MVARNIPLGEAGHVLGQKSYATMSQCIQGLLLDGQEGSGKIFDFFFRIDMTKQQ